jgi:pteridine reductase
MAHVGDPTPPTLADRVALVTGAATRVGRCIAETLGREGMRVAVHYHRNADGAASVQRAIQDSGGQAICLQADLARAEHAKLLVEQVVEQWGRLDLLIPSAANFERIPYPKLDAAAWDRALDLNSRAPYLLAHAATSSLQLTRGSMIFITCSSTITPMRNYLPYVVSKAAVLQLMRVLSLELAPDVRVNAVAPGTVLPPDHFDPHLADAVRSRIPLGRFGTAADVAQAVVYLAKAPFVTGQQLAVDGGRSVAAFESYT